MGFSGNKTLGLLFLGRQLFSPFVKDIDDCTNFQHKRKKKFPGGTGWGRPSRTPQTGPLGLVAATVGLALPPLEQRAQRGGAGSPGRWAGGKGWIMVVESDCQSSIPCFPLLMHRWKIVRGRWAGGRGVGYHVRVWLPILSPYPDLAG